MEIAQDVTAIVVSAGVLGFLYVSGKYVVNQVRPLLNEFLETRFIISDFKRRTKGIK